MISFISIVRYIIIDTTLTGIGNADVTTIVACTFVRGQSVLDTSVLHDSS